MGGSFCSRLGRCRQTGLKKTPIGIFCDVVMSRQIGFTGRLQPSNPAPAQCIRRRITIKKVTQEEIDSMKFAVRVCEQVKSNAIVMVQGLATVGIGPGQTSRVEAVRIAARRAGERADGCVLASDAFFPFADGLEQAAAAGAASIVQPGGSIRDQEVIDAANRLGVSMLFTGHRLFRH